MSLQEKLHRRRKNLKQENVTGDENNWVFDVTSNKRKRTTNKIAIQRTNKITLIDCPGCAFNNASNAIDSLYHALQNQVDEGTPIESLLKYRNTIGKGPKPDVYIIVLSIDSLYREHRESRWVLFSETSYYPNTSMKKKLNEIFTYIDEDTNKTPYFIITHASTFPTITIDKVALDFEFIPRKKILIDDLYLTPNAVERPKFDLKLMRFIHRIFLPFAELQTI